MSFFLSSNPTKPNKLANLQCRFCIWMQMQYARATECWEMFQQYNTRQLLFVVFLFVKLLCLWPKISAMVINFLMRIVVRFLICQTKPYTTKKKNEMEWKRSGKIALVTAFQTTAVGRHTLLVKCSSTTATTTTNKQEKPQPKDSLMGSPFWSLTAKATRSSSENMLFIRD